jgi:thousand and one amino acid protein kinase
VTFLILTANKYVNEAINSDSDSLWWQMELETQQFLQERSERIRLLHERQDRELEQFDEESARLGFRLVPLIKCSTV